MNSQQTNKTKTASFGLNRISPKTMAAIALVSLMLFLWGRVLLTGKNQPQTADAAQFARQADIQEAVQAEQTARQPGIVSVPLSCITGRNDRLTNDIFSDQQWTAFEFHEKEQTVAPVVEVTLQEDPQEKIRKAHQANLDRIAGRLSVEAVIHGADGKPCKVFVDDEVLAVGDVLAVQEGPETYELVLMELSNKEALFTWKGFSMMLKITETVNQ